MEEVNVHEKVLMDFKVYIWMASTKIFFWRKIEKERNWNLQMHFILVNVLGSLKFTLGYKGRWSCNIC